MCHCCLLKGPAGRSWKNLEAAEFLLQCGFIEIFFEVLVWLCLVPLICLVSIISMAQKLNG